MTGEVEEAVLRWPVALPLVDYMRNLAEGVKGSDL